MQKPTIFSYFFYYRHPFNSNGVDIMFHRQFIYPGGGGVKITHTPPCENELTRRNSD